MRVLSTVPALVDASWCLAHLGDPAVRFVEVDERPDRRRYELGHIPGAVSWTWNTQLTHPTIRDIASADQMSRLLCESGIDASTHVVLYGEPSNWFAAWAYWLLKLYGFERVSMLDGGRSWWIGAGLPLSTDLPALRGADDWRPNGARDLRALRSDVLAGLGDGATSIVDVRSEAEYRGDIIAPPLSDEVALRGGHIPGAVSLPWDQTVRVDGTFKNDGDLRGMFDGAGIDAGKDVITYCRIGERSSHTWFVLHELLGYERVRNYDGSWTEWGSSVGVPIERGA